MTEISFDNKVLIEQVRGIESSQSLESDPLQPGPSRDFSGRLLHRAQQLTAQHSLQNTVSHAARIWRHSSLAAACLAALLGGLAVLSAMSTESTLNIYWLLLVLAGFNVLSMLLWLVGVCVGTENLTGGVLSRLSAWLPTLLSKEDTAKGRADRAWLECHFGSAVGKWHLSKLTQQLWLIYLCAGLVVLLLVLSARQYDFVWGTTLLSDDAFVGLTSALGQPLQALGFSIPSAQQVMETRIGAGHTLGAEHRLRWAQFLIGTLLVFGILPRLVLWGVSRALLGSARKRFTLDSYLPYYIHLRQQLMPIHGRSEIVDADTAAPNISPGTGLPERESGSAGRVPNTAQWVAIELSNAVSWPLQHTDMQHDLGQVVDRASLAAVVQQIESDNITELALAVVASRPPDRGLKRTILSLTAVVDQVWLVLVKQSGEPPISDARLTAWYRLAQECNVPAEHVISTVESES